MAKKKANGPAPVAPPKTEVKITAAKGRPMLTWVGKRPQAMMDEQAAQARKPAVPKLPGRADEEPGEPAPARVKVSRAEGKLVVEV